MTSVLVVHHDTAIADVETDSLRAAGYVVEQCIGPIEGGGPCPVMRGDLCPAVAHADVLMYDVWMHGDADRGREMVARLLRDYAGTPIVLTSPGLAPDWPELDAPGVAVLEGRPTRVSLVAAIEAAVGSLADQALAVAR